MKNLKRLGLSFTLISVLAVGAFAGETSCPPSQPQTAPCAPGETQGPPCAGQSVSDVSGVPGETQTPPAAPAVDVTHITDAVLWALSLF